MIADFHTHTNFSGDCESTPETMIEHAIKLGMKQLCITDHYDYDYPDDPDLFLIDFDDYFQKLQFLQEKYCKKIDLRIGVELGLQPHIAEHLSEISNRYPFDFIIGSSHVINKQDPYYPSFFENINEYTAYKIYFETIPQNLILFDNIDVYGHIDYIVRYGPNKNKNYTYDMYADAIDAALKICIDKNIGIEINTAGLAYGLGDVNPNKEIIKRYKELGGQIITIGSDAHTPDKIGYEFNKAVEILKFCGFDYYNIFKNRQAEFIKI